MKKRFIMTTLAMMLLTATVTHGVTFYASKKTYDEKIGQLNKRYEQYSKITEVQGYIDKYFINDFDQQTITDGAAAGMVAFLNDKWSYYLTADQFKELDKSLDNELVGIGVNVAYDVDSGGILVFEVFDDTPAKKAGLHPMDVIYAVDGVEVTQLGYDAAVSAVRGEEGTSVKLSVFRSATNEKLEFNITRKNVEVPAIGSQIFSGGIGYIKIRNFDANVDKTFIEAVNNLIAADVKGIIFDVRNNPGGILQILVNCLDKLHGEVTLITEKDKAGKEIVWTSDANSINLPMAVLVNEHSISAAEFFAASLQEHGKATVIGMPTTGKGCAQTPIKLKDGSGIVLSVKKYYTANGVSLEETKGIVPDVKVELTAEELAHFYKLTQAEDRQLQAAIADITAKLEPEEAKAE